MGKMPLMGSMGSYRPSYTADRIEGRVAVDVARIEDPQRIAEFPVYEVKVGRNVAAVRDAWIAECVENPVVTLLRWLAEQAAPARPGAVILHGGTMPELSAAVAFLRARTSGLGVFVLLTQSSPLQRAGLLLAGADDVMDVGIQPKEAIARLRACHQRISGPQR